MKFWEFSQTIRVRQKETIEKLKVSPWQAEKLKRAARLLARIIRGLAEPKFSLPPSSHIACHGPNVKQDEPDGKCGGIIEK